MLNSSTLLAIESEKEAVKQFLKNSVHFKKMQALCSTTKTKAFKTEFHANGEPVTITSNPYKDLVSNIGKASSFSAILNLIDEHDFDDIPSSLPDVYLKFFMFFNCFKDNDVIFIENALKLKDDIQALLANKEFNRNLNH